MATEKWIAGSGQGFTWGSLFGTEINTTIGIANAILSTVSVSNQSSLDIFMDISYTAGGTVTTVAPNYLGFYLYPLNQDGSTYGDGNYASATASTPPGTYWVGNIIVPVGASTTVQGTVTRIIMPPGTFNMVIFNGTGVAFFNGTNVCKYRTYNRSVA